MSLDRPKAPVTLEEALANGTVEKLFQINCYRPVNEENLWASAMDNDFDIVPVEELNGILKSSNMELTNHHVSIPGDIKSTCDITIKFLDGKGKVGSMTQTPNKGWRFTKQDHSVQILNHDLKTAISTILAQDTTTPAPAPASTASGVLIAAADMAHTAGKTLKNLLPSDSDPLEIPGNIANTIGDKLERVAHGAAKVESGVAFVEGLVHHKAPQTRSAPQAAVESNVDHSKAPEPPPDDFVDLNAMDENSRNTFEGKGRFTNWDGVKLEGEFIRDYSGKSSFICGKKTNQTYAAISSEEGRFNGAHFFVNGTRIYKDGQMDEGTFHDNYLFEGKKTYKDGMVANYKNGELIIEELIIKASSTSTSAPVPATNPLRTEPAVNAPTPEVTSDRLIANLPTSFVEKMERGERVEVMFICTGNFNRSPALELLTKQALKAYPRLQNVSVQSRGTKNWMGTGDKINLCLTDVIPEGIALISQQLTRDEAVKADLFLAVADYNANILKEEYGVPPELIIILPELLYSEKVESLYDPQTIMGNSSSTQEEKMVATQKMLEELKNIVDKGIIPALNMVASQTTIEPPVAPFEFESLAAPAEAETPPPAPKIHSIILKEGGSISNNPEAVKTYPFGHLAAFTHEGYNYGDHNEDRVVINEVLDENGTVIGVDIFVIDGMGGYGGGERAADIFAEECKNCEDLQEMVTRIKTRLDSDPVTREEGGVCWVVAKIRGNDMTVARMGDARMSKWDSSGKLTDHTDDESAAYTALKNGKLTLNDPKYYAKRNVVSNALQGGPHEYNFDAHIFNYTLAEGDTVRLCSDGITDNFTEDEEMAFMAGLTAKTAAYRIFKQTAPRMTGAYNGASKILEGKPDNMSCVIYVHGTSNKVASVKSASTTVEPNFDAPTQQWLNESPSDQTEPETIASNTRAKILTTVGIASGALAIGLATVLVGAEVNDLWHKYKNEAEKFDLGGWTPRTAPLPDGDEAGKELATSHVEAIIVIGCDSGKPVLANCIHYADEELPTFDYNVDQKLEQPIGFQKISPNPFELCKAEGAGTWQYSLVR